ncbi:MAG: HIT domain-containing protein [Mycobacterium sp.]|nr:HIT domain-containing protein [Mycobacterium sp.]
MPVSTVGLYDDARYPGRVLVSARDHYDHLDEMPATALNAFMLDVQHTARALRRWADVDRINVAVLGNNTAHVHAHVIPRRATERNADRAPWDGAEPRRPLAGADKIRIVADLCSLMATDR